LLTILLTTGPLCSVISEAEPGGLAMPREQMGLDYAIERLVSFLPRESWTLVRNSVLAVFQPCLPFILPPLYLVFGDAFAPFTHWIVYSLGPLNRVSTYILNVVLFSCAPTIFCFSIGFYPMGIMGIFQQLSPRLISRNVLIEQAVSFFSGFLPISLAQIATGLAMLIYDVLLLPASWVTLLPWLLLTGLFMPFMLALSVLSIPIEIPWFMLCFPASVALLILSAPFRVAISAMVRHYLPIYRIFATG